MKQTLLLLIIVFLPLNINADTVEVDGIYYDLDNSTKQAEVTESPKKYSGSVVIPETINFEGVKYNVTSISSTAFYYCTSLTSVKIPNSVTSIKNGAFCQCVELNSIDIPNGITSIGDYAFEMCNLTSLKIPNSVISIGEYAFLNCSKLSSIKVDKDNPIYDSRKDCNAIIETTSNSLILGCKNTVIPNSIVAIGVGAFQGSSELVSIKIPDNVISIGPYAFKGCTKLTSISIPNGVTSIESGTFQWCNELNSINIPNSVTSIGDEAFESCGLTSLKIPSSVNKINGSAFRNCRSLLSIKVDKDNPIYDSRESCNAIVETASNTLIRGCKKTIIPNSITIIGDGAFWAADLSTISIPSNVEVIGWDAFNSNINLKSITIPDGLVEIKGGAFCNCAKLKTIELPSSVSTIGIMAFEMTAWLENQQNGLVYCGNVAYKYKGTMPDNTQIKLKEGTLGIAGGAFQSCHGLTSIIIPNSVTNIGDYSFSECSGLTSITLPNSLLSIGVMTFAGCSLYGVTLGENLTNIGFYAFSGYQLKDVYCYAQKVPCTDGSFENRGSATLHVPTNAISQYQDTFEWNQFRYIVPLTDSDPKPTKVESIKSERCEPQNIYTLDGFLRNQPQKGLNIIKMKDGSVKKIVVK